MRTKLYIGIGILLIVLSTACTNNESTYPQGQNGTFEEGIARGQLNILTQLTPPKDCMTVLYSTNETGLLGINIVCPEDQK